MRNGRAEGTGANLDLVLFARVGAGWRSTTWAPKVRRGAAHSASACPLQMDPQETIPSGQGCQRTYHREHHRMGHQGQHRSAAAGEASGPRGQHCQRASVFKANMQVCVLMDSECRYRIPESNPRRELCNSQCLALYHSRKPSFTLKGTRMTLVNPGCTICLSK